MSAYRDGVKIKRNSDDKVFELVRHPKKSMHGGERLFSLVSKNSLSPAGYFTPSYMDEYFSIVDGQRLGW